MEILIILAFLLDLIIGDPKYLPHPVVFIGKIIDKGEKICRKLAHSEIALKISGLILSLSIILTTYFFFFLLLKGAFALDNYLGIALSIVITAQALSVKSLYQHAMNVVLPLEEGKLEKARKELSMMVGRDTENLQESEIIRATVESVSENTVDGISAPMFYAFLGGPPLAMAYKAINTLDSMIAYKNEKYLHFGWAAARIDDMANYIPARLTGLLYLFIAPFTPGGFSQVWRIIRRDSQKHASPNSGIAEAAVAGALKIHLGGSSFYQGVERVSPLIGEAIYRIENKHIKQSLIIMLSISISMLFWGTLISYYIR